MNVDQQNDLGYVVGMTAFLFEMYRYCDIGVLTTAFKHKLLTRKVDPIIASLQIVPHYNALGIRTGYNGAKMSFLQMYKYIWGEFGGGLVKPLPLNYNHQAVALQEYYRLNNIELDIVNLTKLYHQIKQGDYNIHYPICAKVTENLKLNRHTGTVFSEYAMLSQLKRFGCAMNTHTINSLIQNNEINKAQYGISSIEFSGDIADWFETFTHMRRIGGQLGVWVRQTFMEQFLDRFITHPEIIDYLFRIAKKEKTIAVWDKIIDYIKEKFEIQISYGSTKYEIKTTNIEFVKEFRTTFKNYEPLRHICYLRYLLYSEVNIVNVKGILDASQTTT